MLNKVVDFSPVILHAPRPERRKAKSMWGRLLTFFFFISSEHSNSHDLLPALLLQCCHQWTKDRSGDKEHIYTYRSKDPKLKEIRNCFLVLYAQLWSCLPLRRSSVFFSLLSLYLILCLFSKVVQPCGCFLNCCFLFLDSCFLSLCSCTFFHSQFVTFWGHYQAV